MTQSSASNELPFWKQIWNDSVWSKVIGSAFSFLLGILATLVMGFLTRNWLCSVIIGLFLVAWGYCFWLRYRRATRIEDPFSLSKPYLYRDPLRRRALWGIWLLPACFFLALAAQWYWANRPTGKIIVAVANFDDGKPENYRVTDLLLLRLKKIAKDYPDIQILPLNETITEQQGSEYAKSKGAELRATLVLWGYYSEKEEPFLLVHVERLGGEHALSLVAEEERLEVPLGERPSITFRQRFPTDMASLVLFAVGLARYEAGKYENAVRAFSDALQVGPAPGQLFGAEELYFYRGTALAGEQKYQSAIADFDESIKAAPTATAFYNRGLVHAKQGNFDRALGDFDETVGREPDNGDAFGIRGVVHWMRGDVDSAIADCSKAIELASPERRWVAYSVRGAAYGKKQDFSRAIADLTMSADLNPTDPLTLRRRGAIYVLTSQFDLAAEDFDRAVMLDPGNATSYFQRGDVYWVKIAKESGATNPGDGPLRVNTKDLDLCLGNYDKAIALKPNYAEAYDRRGFLYVFLGEREKAIADYRKVLELSTTSSLRQSAQDMLVKLDATSK